MGYSGGTTEYGRENFPSSSPKGEAETAAAFCLNAAAPRCVLRPYARSGVRTAPAFPVFTAPAVRKYLSGCGDAYLALFAILPAAGLPRSDLPAEISEEILSSALRGVLEVFADSVAADLALSLGRKTADPLFLTDDTCTPASISALCAALDPEDRLRLRTAEKDPLAQNGAAVALIGVTDLPVRTDRCGRANPSGCCTACSSARSVCVGCQVRKNTEK